MSGGLEFLRAVVISIISVGMSSVCWLELVRMLDAGFFIIFSWLLALGEVVGRFECSLS